MVGQDLSRSLQFSGLYIYICVCMFLYNDISLFTIVGVGLSSDLQYLDLQAPLSKVPPPRLPRLRLPRLGWGGPTCRAAPQVTRMKTRAKQQWDSAPVLVQMPPSHTRVEKGSHTHIYIYRDVPLYTQALGHLTGRLCLFMAEVARF